MFYPNLRPLGYFTLFLLCLLTATHLEAADPPRYPAVTMAEINAELLKHYNIEMGVIQGANVWSRDETLGVVELLDALPAALSYPLRSSADQAPLPAPLILVKNQPFLSRHTLGRVFSHTLNITVDSESLPQMRRLAIKKQLLSHLITLYDRQHATSNSREWRQLSGWDHYTLLGFKLPYGIREAYNQSPAAYALPQGSESPAADFLSTALGYFLPEISAGNKPLNCRLPRKYDFIHRLFSAYPVERFGPSPPCASMDYGLLDDLEFYDPKTGQPISMGPINAETVEGFEIMYATPGVDDAAEIAGHLVLRIKLNNNPRARHNHLENPHDLVISFLADTDTHQRPKTPENIQIPLDCQKNWLNLVNDTPYDENAIESIIQSIYGLSGGFLTVMDRQTLEQTIKNYTIEQDRDLVRFRLNISPRQKEALLIRLYQAKRNFKAKYYFFSRNCASVLMRIIAEGIGDPELKAFDHLSSPPNTLLSLLLRKGVVTPVYPSFYSYRKKGQIAQELLAAAHRQVVTQFPACVFPSVSDLIGKDEATRGLAVSRLQYVAKQHPEMRSAIYRLAVILQTAEMAYSYKGLVCERYTNEISAEIRELQQFILQNATGPVDTYRFNMESAINQFYIDREKKGASQGQPHTRHYTMTMGPGYLRANYAKALPIIKLEGAVHHQEMGSTSAIPMQRGSYIDLGKSELIFAHGTHHRGELRQWALTALKLEKFRERLDRIPAPFEPSGNIGLGLTVLDMAHNREVGRLGGTLIGGEILGQLISSDYNNDGVFMGLGLASVYQRQKQNRLSPGPTLEAVGINLPLKVKTHLSLGFHHEWQWRNQLTYSYAFNPKISNSLRFRTDLGFRPLKIADGRWVIHCRLDYEKEYPNACCQDSLESLTGSLLLEINPW